MDNVLPALGLTFLAGFSTVLGGLTCKYIGKETSVRMGVALALTAGVMVCLSIVELIPQGTRLLTTQNSPQLGGILALHALLIGTLLVYFLDKNYKAKHEDSNLLYRSSLFIAISITLHNFPEGMITLTTSLIDLKLGVTSAIAVALHNIPEGIAVAVPIYKLTGNYKKAVFFSFLSGMAEPLGAIIGLVFLNNFMNDIVLGSILCGVAGVMIYVSLIQIIPMARAMAKPSVVLSAALFGSAVMAGSIIFIS